MQENNIIDIRNEDGKLVGRFCFENRHADHQTQGLRYRYPLPVRRRTGGDQSQDRITTDAP